MACSIRTHHSSPPICSCWRERDGQWGENKTLVVGAHLNCSPHSMHSSLVGRCTGQLASSYSLARYITAMLVMPYHTVLESHLDQNLTHSTGACSHLTHFFLSVGAQLHHSVTCHPIFTSCHDDTRDVPTSNQCLSLLYLSRFRPALPASCLLGRSHKGVLCVGGTGSSWS